jgi:hypothetical protein
MKVYKGDSWDITASIKNSENNPVVLDQATIKIQVRKKHGDPVLFEISTTGGGITVGGDDFNEIRWNSIVDLPEGIYKWDLQVLFFGGTVRTIFAGQFKVYSDITE